MSKLKSALRGALIICAVVFAGYGSGVAQRHINDAAHANDPIRITFNPGGSVVEFIEDFTEQRNAGKRYIIDGLCISACTMILGLIPRITCASRRTPSSRSTLRHMSTR
jgi:hypothetical protein